MRTATLEVLNEGELIFGTRTNGSYFVREYEDNEEVAGSFFIIFILAKAYIETLNEK
jgi:hypothetical protein